MFPGSVSYLYTHHLHTVSGCLANYTVTQSDTLIFTARFLHAYSTLSIVDLWVIDVALDADYDTAKLSDSCYPPKDV
jgi:hypothetical protein